MISQRDLSILGTTPGTLRSTQHQQFLLCQRHYPLEIKGHFGRVGIFQSRHKMNLTFPQDFVPFIFKEQ